AAHDFHPALGSDTRIADHLRPLWHVGLNPRFDLIWRHGSRLVADRLHFLLDVWRGNRTRDFAVEELDDVAWRAHRRPDALRRLLHLAGRDTSGFRGSANRAAAPSWLHQLTRHVNALWALIPNQSRLA